MRGTGRVLAIVLVGGLGAAVPAAAKSVDLALVLAVDVSGSVNNERFELQRRGYAEAFASREVMEAIAAGENHAIAVTLVEWSGAGHQRQFVGWTPITATTSLAAPARSRWPRAISIPSAPPSSASWCARSPARQGQRQSPWPRLRASDRRDGAPAHAALAAAGPSFGRRTAGGRSSMGHCSEAARKPMTMSASQAMP